MPNENLVSAESSTATSIAGSSGLAQHRKTKRGSCEEQGTQKSQRRAPLLDVSNVPAHEAHVSTPIHDASSPLDGGFFDIDRAHDPFSMGEYDPEIDENHRIAERNFQPNASYMENTQREINPQMRGILIDWLIEVAEEYKLRPETLFIAVNYIDRFLAKSPVQRGKLQLVGITAMLIAAKYEEIYAPVVDDFVYISDNTYTREEVLTMESVVLNTLNFELSTISILKFLARFLKAARLDQLVPVADHAKKVSEMKLFAEYVAELTLQDYKFIKVLPSKVAAAVVSLTLRVFRQADWTPTLQHYTKYQLQDLQPCLALLAQTLQGSAPTAGQQPLQAVRDKYRSSKFGRVSALSLDALQPMP